MPSIGTLHEGTQLRHLSSLLVGYAVMPRWRLGFPDPKFLGEQLAGDILDLLVPDALQVLKRTPLGLKLAACLDEFGYQLDVQRGTRRTSNRPGLRPSKIRA
jgi:hypothetical protein